MPFKNIAEAKEKNFPSSIEDIALTLGQINTIASIFDSVQNRPNIENPMAIAISTFKRSYKISDGKFVPKQDMSESYLEQCLEEEFAEIAKQTFRVDGKEIFRTGTHTDSIGRKRTYTIQDLDKVVSAFKEGARLSDGLPLKLRLGHDVDQNLLHASGMPAAGWIENIYRSGESLFADIKDIPKVIAEFIETKAYRNLSAGLLRDFTDKALNKTFDLVLGHVGLLGDELPSIKSLGAWGALYKAQDEKSVEVITFSIKDGEIENEDVGSKEDDEAKLQEEEDMKELEAKNAELQKKIDAKDAEIKDYKENKVKSEQKAQDAALEAKKDKVKNFMESRTVQERVLPINKSLFSEMLLKADESEEVTFTEKDGKESKITKYEEVKRHIESLPVVVDLKEHSEGKGQENKVPASDVLVGTYNENSEKLDKEANEYMEKHEGVIYVEALKKVAVQHPEFLESDIAT